MKNEGGKFTDVTADIAGDLLRPGMATDAVWTDYNNDYLQLVKGNKFSAD